MEGNRVLGVSMLASPDKMSVNPNLPKGDVLCHFVLPILIEEDEGVLLCVTAVVLAPSTSRVVGVVELLSELGNIGNRTRSRGKGDGGVIHGEPNGFVCLNFLIQHVAFNFVKDLRNEE